MLEAGVAKHRFTVEEFHKMGEAGIFSEDDRVELVEGEIVEMTPIGWRHVQAVDLLNAEFNRWVVLTGAEAGLGDVRVGVQNPLLLHAHGEHQPDLLLYRSEGVRGRLPEAGDALVVVEVADTSLSYDKNVKLPLYAKSGVPEAWLVDLHAGIVEVHSAPRAPQGTPQGRLAEPGGYTTVARYSAGERVRSATVAGLEVATEDVLPGP